jgi:4-hydroxybenzoate polyprenyltransferase
MFTHIRHILEMIRFSHTLFALPFALLAALMAWRVNGADFQFRWMLADSTIPDAAPQVSIFEIKRLEHDFRRPMPKGLSVRWQEVVGILLCMVTGRSAAMALNRLADREFDALNPRTAGRHLPTGTLSATSVAGFATATSVTFVASTLVLLPNRLPLYLSIPTLLILFGYSYSKRFTWLSHFWLGGALGLAPVFAWIAIRGEIVTVNPWDLLPVVVLGGAVKLWVAGFDIIYACQDVEFDRAHGLHSMPARFGVKTALGIAAACHFGMLVLLALVPLVYPLMIGWIWWAGVVAIAALLVYEHGLVKPDDLARVNVAFFNVNTIVSIGLLAVGTIAILV